jgi:hypothetical protein
MTHGVSSNEPTTSHIENVNAGERQSSTPAAAANVDPIIDKEKERIIEGLEGAMDLFRKGECSRFQASALILDELAKWSGATDQEKGKAFDTYLAEINSFLTVQDESISLARKGPPSIGAPIEPGSKSKRTRDEAEQFLDEISRGELDDEGDEPRMAKR